MLTHDHKSHCRTLSGSSVRFLHREKSHANGYHQRANSYKPNSLHICVGPHRSLAVCVGPQRSPALSVPGPRCALCPSGPGALCVGPGGLWCWARRFVCRGSVLPAVRVGVALSGPAVSGPGALCVREPGALCVGPRRFVCRARALCQGPGALSVSVGPRRSLLGPLPHFLALATPQLRSVFHPAGPASRSVCHPVIRATCGPGALDRIRVPPIQPGAFPFSRREPNLTAWGMTLHYVTFT